MSSNMVEVPIEQVESAFNQAVKDGDLQKSDILGAYLARYAGMERTGGTRNLSEGEDVRDTTGDPITDAAYLGLEQRPRDSYKSPEHLELKSVATGAVEGSMVFPGLIAGAKLGGAGGALVGGVGAIPGAIVGAIFGAWAGFKAGDYVNEKIANSTGLTLSDKEIEALDSDDYEKFYFWSMGGSVVSGGGATSLVGKTGVKFAPNFTSKVYKSASLTKASATKAAALNFTGTKLNDIMTFAAKHPVKYMAGEAAIVPSAYAGGKFAEDLYGEQNGLARMTGEAIGGILNPLSFLATGVKEGYKGTVSFYNRTLTKKGLETQGKSEMARLWRASGKDPDVDQVMAEISYMRQEVLDHENVAMLSGNPKLVAISKELEKHSPAFAENNKKALQEMTQSIEDSINGLKASGDPEDLIAAAELEYNYVTKMIDADIATTEKKAIMHASEIIDSDLAYNPKKMMNLSKQVTDEFTESLNRARAIEKSYWDKVQHVEVNRENFNNIFNAFDEIKGDFSEEQLSEILSKNTREFFSNIEFQLGDKEIETGMFDAKGNPITKKSSEVVTSERIQKFRSWMLDKASEAVKSGEKGKIRAYTKLADAALNDLEGSGMADESYRMAREVSFHLNETFTRSFLGQRAAVGRYGLQKSPELLLTEVFKQGDEAAEVMLSDIDEISRFMDSYASPDMIEETDRVMGVIRGAQENMFKIVASKYFDAKEGLIDPKGLKKFAKEKAILLNRFPDVKKVVDDALDNEVTRLEFQSQLKNTTVTFEKKGAYASLLGKEPVKAVRTALRSELPFKELDKMVEVVEKATQVDKGVARLGLRSAIMEAALANSVNSSGELNLKALRHQLTKPFGAQETSLLEYASKKGLFDAEDNARIEYLLKKIENLEIYKSPGDAIGDIETGSDFMLSEAVQVGSGRFGLFAHKTIFGEGNSMPSLMVVGRSTKIGKRLFDSMPKAKVTDFMVNLMEDPKMFMDVMNVEMKKGKVVKLAGELTYRRGYAAIYRGGFTSDEDEKQPPEELEGLYNEGTGQ